MVANLHLAPALDEPPSTGRGVELTAVPDERSPNIREYRLRLDLDFARLRWNGTVEFDPPAAEGTIALDCEGPSVSAARLGDRSLPFHQDLDGRSVSLEIPKASAGPVALDFSGDVETKNLFGLYRSRNGSDYVLTSHCEPTGARRIFPCVDRPDRKARIVLTVRAPADLDVISNTPARSVRGVDGRKEWAFEPTPEMSTYLFYLGVGKFDLREEGTGKVAVRVAAPPGRGDASGWALRSAGRILKAYEEYYGIAYPLPKLDLIAIREHAFGAMENWGAISFQESRLLVDAGSSSFATHDVFTTTAHEIAHQWFGNLVTMRWWDDIWLNESFAALMETKITETLEPTFEPWNEFMLRNAGKAQALEGDSLRSTHPVRSRVESPEEMTQIFDAISYGKGSSVLAMLDRYLGEERFRAGVTDYLRRFRFQNARTEDLFAALERASGEPVSALAGPWIDRPGLPVVTAHQEGEEIVLSQRRFAYLGATDEPPWPIPMVIEIDGRSERVLFDSKERRLSFPPGSTVLLNPRSIGFYRVLYERPWLDRLLGILPKRPGLDAWAVVEDLSAFVLSGDVDWSTYARAAEAFADSHERVVVQTLAGSLGGFALELAGRREVEGPARSFLARQWTRIGSEPRPTEPAGTGIDRDRVAYARVRVDADFASELSPRFDDWDRLDPDLRRSTAIARVRAGGAAGYQAVRRRLDSAETDIDAFRLVRALAWSDQPARIREVLDLAAAGGINRSHVLYVASEAAANPAGRDVAWEWLRERVGPLSEIFRGSGYLPLLLEHTLPFLGRGRAAEVHRFFDDHPVPEGSRGLANGLERLEVGEQLARRLS